MGAEVVIQDAPKPYWGIDVNVNVIGVSPIPVELHGFVAKSRLAGHLNIFEWLKSLGAFFETAPGVQAWWAL